MYPNWGRYGGSSHYPPPPVPPPPPVALPEASPGPGYSSSTAPSSSGFMSFREQHLAQLQQLQQMHQKQMQCVLQPHHLPPPPMPPPPVMPGGSYGDWQPPPPPMPPPPGPALSYQKQQQYKHQMLHHQRDGPPALVPMELDSPPESPPVPPGSYMPPSQPYMPPPSYYPPSSSQSYPPPAQPSPSQSPPPQSYLAPTSYSSSTTSTSTSTSSSYLSHSQAYLPSSQASPSRPSQGHPKSQPQAPPPPAGPSGNKAPVQPEPSESGPKNKSSEKQQATSEPDPSKMTPQEQQQYWYRQHLLSLQQRTKARLPAHRKGPAVAKDAPEPVKEVVTVPAASQEAKPPSSEEPPLPPSGEEVPPPLPPEEPQSEDPEEDARLKQLQAAAAHWQQHQQHRVGLQYQGIMQKHTQLQQILQQYQQMIQQPPHIQTMSLDMQLRHYEMQQQQFQHLYQDWEREFQLWEEQLHSYPHKDQLQEYEKQWKTWQGHMKASQNYLQEKVNALQNMKNQYMGNMSMPPPFAPYSQMPPPPPTMPPPVLPPSLPPPVMPPALPATVPPPGMPPPVMPPSLPTSVPPPGMPPSLSSAGPPPGLPPPSLSTTGPPPVLPPPSLSSTAPPPVMPLPPLSSATPPPGIPPPGVPQGIPSQLTKGLPASSSQSSQVPEKPRPALLPTPVSFGSGPPSAYHSPMQSDQMNSKAPLIKSAPPYSSFSSEQGLGDSSAVSTGVKDMPVRSGGLLPDPPRSSYLEGPRGPRYRDDRWREERNRDHGHGYDRDFRDRGELRIREYPERGDAWRDKRDYAPDRMDWERERLSDRWYTSDVDRHSPMAEHMPSTHHSSEVMGSDANLDSDQGLGGVMVLSQRQHEIILKAAQELKMLREQKEQLQKMKAFGSEPQMPDHPPPQDSSRLQSTVSRPGMYPPPGPYRPPPPMGKPPPGSIMRPPVPPARSSIPMNRPPVPGPPPIPPLPPPPPVMKSQASGVAQERWDEDSFYGLWDTNDDQGLNSEFKSENTTIPSGPVLPLPPGHPSIPPPGPMPMGMPPMSNQPPVQQTVDYGHGRDMATNKVEQIPYGERVTLRPDPVPERSTFETDHTGQRDRYDRDRDREPYFDRQSNVMADHRDFKRDRETHRDRDRDRGVMDYDRDRFDRDRRSRDDRTQSYRDKKDHSSSRRGGFDRPSYDRKSDRPAYEGPSMFGGERRTYPEERMPLSTPALSHQPPPAPRVEKKPESKNVDDILKPPGRESRPERIVVIMRGLPGSGKTHVAKLIRDKEVEFGGPAPRVLSLDDYFIAEVEKEEKDPDSGKKVKKKVMEYEYEAEMEETYRTSMFKAFKKTLDDGFFPFIILDAINDRVRHFDQFWSAAKTKGFEVYLAEMSADNQTCGKRNIHGRKLKEINKMADHWETAPRHMMRLDIRSLLQDAAIEEVEMEDFDANIEEQKEEKKDAEEEESELGYIPKSKWEMDTSEAKLDKLDGLRTGTKRKRDWEAIASRMEDYLQLPDDYDTRASEPGKKRVRWADLEEKKDADRKRAIGFVVGQTDWEKITDESGHLAEKALNRTKYI
ncbi:YLP motif-containing protein 1 isoform X3 [Tenrec ecaudatus]|uniref:YLP motif-containing protein 1 isoform X3 n=1 Tax=Tenrec ecaudatus TaxID=94439 RepID=UPI003F5A5A26